MLVGHVASIGLAGFLAYAQDLTEGQAFCRKKTPLIACPTVTLLFFAERAPFGFTVH